MIKKLTPNTFENQPALHEHYNDLREKLILQTMLNQQVTEPPQRITIGNLVARIHLTEV